MRVLILADDFFAAREQALLMRLEVGLADEGVRVLHAIPAAAAAYAPGELISRVAVYHPPRWAFGVAPAARALLRDLARLLDADDAPPIDLVHVMGGSAWSVGAALAREAGIPAVYEVWRCGMGDRARAIARASEGPTLFIAPDPIIERELRAALPHDALVRAIPWGVHAATQPRAPRDPSRAPSAMLVGAGRDPAAFAAVLEAVARVGERGPLMLFCDAEAARRANVFARAKRLRLSDRLSLIAELEGRRDLALAGDLLLQPEARGEQRSVTLDAMAHGMLVVAAADPKVSYLIDNTTASVVPPTSVDAWAAAITKLLSDSAAADSLAASALHYVREHHRAYDQVRAILDAYASLQGTIAKVG